MFLTLGLNILEWLLFCYVHLCLAQAQVHASAFVDYAAAVDSPKNGGVKDRTKT